ncbi:LysR family transcriptional regulator [Serratia silvae]|uniref:LysR family transcriptional regulator n=1 Tax=Serratia silvae TaxID=2824122 RepID=A0ABT0KB00_9GAMM|nr:LysR family transcriptional regulator [Serratia silvae]MCL1029087.1 LysR family transcriptional regulator [Serratia silvae]
MSRYFDDVQMGSIELFCLAVETGSFTAAASAAGVTPAAVSRSVARLEKRLQAKLFIRTTRSMRTTDTGQSYYLECRKALSQLVEAEAKISGERQMPVGTLSISAPTLYAHYRLIPRLTEFCSRYPDLTINLEVSNQNIDFSEDKFDVAIRGSELNDSGLVARRLEDAELIVVATPAYLLHHSIPVEPADLAHHECIQYVLPSNGRQIPWTFIEHDKVIKVETTGRFVCREDFLATLTLVKNGAGLMQVYRFVVEQDLQRGELIEVLPAYAGTSRPFILIYPYARYVPLKIRKLIDFLAEF